MEIEAVNTSVCSSCSKVAQHKVKERIITRKQLVEHIPPPHHNKINTVSLLPVSSRYIGLNFWAVHHNQFSRFHLHFSQHMTTGWCANTTKYRQYIPN